MQKEKNDLQRQKDEGIYKRISKRHKDGDLVSALLGLTSESGEAAQLLRDCIDKGSRLNYGALAMELCDVAHYLVMACNMMECTIDDLLALNDAKMDALDAGERQHFETEMKQWKKHDVALSDKVSEVKGSIIPMPHFQHQ